MSSRIEEKARRKAEREALEKSEARAASRARRLRYAGGGVAVVAIAAIIAITSLGGSSSKGSTDKGGTPTLSVTSLASLGKLAPASTPTTIGPEGVSVPTAPPLAPTATPAGGSTVDGIQCLSNEQLQFHIHAHLNVFVNGVARQVPYGIGITGAQAQPSPQGPFVVNGSCFYWLHVHAADGIIHIESPVQRTYTLGNFFDIWGQPLSTTRVGTASGQVVAIYNGRHYTGNPRNIPLNSHAQIQLEVGRPLIAPVTVSFPNGL